MPAQIAPTALVDPQAELADGVAIGPFCVIGPQVKIGRGTRLENNVTLTGRVELGEENHLFPNVVIGTPPQDLSYRGGETRVAIGDHNLIREGVTIHRGTEKEEGLTSVGNHCFLMANSHIAHDCRIGDRVLIANGTLLGGHVVIHDDATLSGGVAVHHFTTIGSHSFIGGVSRVVQDVPPYILVEGVPARPRCVNLVGLKRHGFPPETIAALHEAYKLLFRARVGIDEARVTLREKGYLVPQVTRLIAFIEEQSDGRQGRARDRRRAA